MSEEELYENALEAWKTCLESMGSWDAIEEDLVTVLEVFKISYPPEIYRESFDDRLVQYGCQTFVKKSAE
eukprot:CAMPEP_0117046226 /NCGR_PEP_ID=MMETSP0472-20121206/31968_1 /TAXON_ID=693140 ORGANISM="Tiarina fusus, Strain LIS" /NCGR_SAMPLE_ID=MMETSP0472 /ASSEMBLY_ACC=CAM_ASM_000603 /LENGTH=69 /DNA_ID=CAMNT_0004758507 /DNA_START=8 /DNA_END=217 /DNA_ORIENTATION=-